MLYDTTHNKFDNYRDFVDRCGNVSNFTNTADMPMTYALPVGKI